MKPFFTRVKDAFFAGLIFLLPLLVLFAVLAKVNQSAKGIFIKLAGIFGLKSFAGLTSATWAAALSFVVLCLLLGLLAKNKLFRSIHDWLDERLANIIPGYAVYREMAMNKLEAKEELLPYNKAGWLQLQNMQRPCFIMEESAAQQLIIFLPEAGNSKKGINALVDRSQVIPIEADDIKAFKLAIDNIGIGLNAFVR